ncbi:hypothetical protein [Trinickia dinghuensis]|uniref:Uncharacterized protein n=1 Tax=Trinickia dinghuensis TaxID=2291023 RepID=A0A3D8K1W3_9BURK|nr:hypothetical protein [Trinickia dinghuensis]RDU98896.1 hypothetical protein DWV00_11630 [Trinickia dinghuensis]
MHTDDGVPEVEVLTGQLHQLRMDTSQNTEGNRTRIFRFTTGGRHCVFYAATFLGSRNAFLAEGDRVELAVQSPVDGKQEEIPVYAIRNLEDGDVYVSHSMSQWRPDRKGLPRLSLRQQRSLLMQFGAVVVIVWLIFGVAWRAFDADGAVGRQIFYVASAVLPAAWLTPAVTMCGYRLRWSLGMPTDRQCLQEKVYAALSLSSPLSVPSRVYDV